MVKVTVKAYLHYALSLQYVFVTVYILTYNSLRGFASILWVHAYSQLEMIFCFLSKRMGIGFLPTNCEDVIHVSYDAKTNIFQISINMTIRSIAVNNAIRLIQRFKSLCTVYHVLTNMF